MHQQLDYLSLSPSPNTSSLHLTTKWRVGLATDESITLSVQAEMGIPPLAMLGRAEI